MDLFAAQGRSLRDSRLLVATLILVLAAMAVVVHVAVVGVSIALGGSADWLAPSNPAVAAIALLWTTVLLGGFFRWLDVRAGGAALARRFGARPAAGDDRDERVRSLGAAVAEVAIAANRAPPEVHVLERESGINAFVVGTSARPAVVVSRGALDALERDELRAVVAHEIAHVVHGDLELNMRVLVALGALTALDEVGRTLIGTRAACARGGPASARMAAFVHPGVLIGWPLRALGSIGLFAAGAVRAALSRRREFLADASAAQFIRQPFALASALATIRDTEGGGVLHTPHAAAIAHLCIHADARRRWMGAVFASHPPLQRRIDALDRHTDVKRRAASRRNANGTGRSGVEPGAAARPAAHAAETDAGSGVGSGVVSDRITLLLSGGVDCLAALCALFAGTDPIARRDYVGALRFTFDDRLATRVEVLLSTLAGELRGDGVGLVEHACSVLRGQVTRENRNRFLLRLERLLESRGELDLGRYATLSLVRRKLDVEFPVLERLASTAAGDTLAGGRRVKTFDAMGEEFALLLSLMVESSGAPDEVLDREFIRVLRCYTSASLPRRTGTEAGIVAELERAFQTLYVQPETIRRAFVAHCIEIMQADGRVARAERSLLGLFAASLGCEELAA